MLHAAAASMPLAVSRGRTVSLGMTLPNTDCSSSRCPGLLYSAALLFGVAIDASVRRIHARCPGCRRGLGRMEGIGVADRLDRLDRTELLRGRELSRPGQPAV